MKVHGEIQKKNKASNLAGRTARHELERETSCSSPRVRQRGRVLNMAGENDVVGAQSRPSGFGFISPPLRLVLKGVEKKRTRMNKAT